MQSDLEAIAARLSNLQAPLKPLQVAGGTLTPLHARRLVQDLERSIVDILFQARRAGELIRLVVEAGAEEPAAPVPAPLRVIEGGRRGGAAPRRRAKAPPRAPDDDGPRAA